MLVVPAKTEKLLFTLAKWDISVAASISNFSKHVCWKL